ncbi:MAG: hypothetical protein C0P68_009480 [Bacillota bacterium]
MVTGGLPFWLEWLVGGLALYGVSHVVTAVFRRLFRLEARPHRPTYYVLWTSQSAEHVEYWLRRIRWEAKWTGRDYRIVWRDEQSSDDTRSIVERIAGEWHHTNEEEQYVISEGLCAASENYAAIGEGRHAVAEGMNGSPLHSAVLLDLRVVRPIGVALFGKR